MKTDLILVTGTTGYVGGRLTPALFTAGYRVRAMGRNLGKWAAGPGSVTTGSSWFKGTF